MAISVGNVIKATNLWILNDPGVYHLVYHQFLTSHTLIHGLEESLGDLDMVFFYGLEAASTQGLPNLVSQHTTGAH